MNAKSKSLHSDPVRRKMYNYPVCRHGDMSTANILLSLPSQPRTPIQTYLFEGLAGFIPGEPSSCGNIRPLSPSRSILGPSCQQLVLTLRVTLQYKYKCHSTLHQDEQLPHAVEGCTARGRHSLLTMAAIIILGAVVWAETNSGNYGVRKG